MDSPAEIAKVDRPEAQSNAVDVVTPTASVTQPMELDVSGVCSRCRCAWLCCDCHLGCCVCKQRRHYCYCPWTNVPNTKCDFCVHWLPQCRCNLKYRCKWCQVSMRQCRWGGCIRFLPNRLSPEGQQYISLFMNEDGPEAELLHPGDLDNESIKSFDTLAPEMNIASMPALPNVDEETGKSRSSPMASWFEQFDSRMGGDTGSSSGVSSRLSGSSLSIDHE